MFPSLSERSAFPTDTVDALVREEGTLVSISFREECLSYGLENFSSIDINFGKFPSLSERSAFPTCTITKWEVMNMILVSISFREECLSYKC